VYIGPGEQRARIDIELNEFVCTSLYTCLPACLSPASFITIIIVKRRRVASANNTPVQTAETWHDFTRCSINALFPLSQYTN